MSRFKGELKNSYWTSYSLVAPVESCLDEIGKNRVAVYANAPELPKLVMGDLKRQFEESNSGDLRPIMRNVVQESERQAVPLACIILGKF